MPQAVCVSAQGVSFYVQEVQEAQSSTICSDCSGSCCDAPSSSANSSDHAFHHLFQGQRLAKEKRAADLQIKNAEKNIRNAKLHLNTAKVAHETAQEGHQGLFIIAFAGDTESARTSRLCYGLDNV